MSFPKRELLIICDASPLILLAKVGRLDLLASCRTLLGARDQSRSLRCG